MVKNVWQQNEMTSQGWINRDRRAPLGELTIIESVYQTHSNASSNSNPQRATQLQQRSRRGPSPSTPLTSNKRPPLVRVPVVLPDQPSEEEIARCRAQRAPTPPPEPIGLGHFEEPVCREYSSDTDSDDSDQENEPPKPEPKLTIRIPPLSKARQQCSPAPDEVVTTGKRRREDDLPRSVNQNTPSSSYGRETPGVSIETFEVADPFDDDEMDVDSLLAATIQDKGKGNSRSDSGSYVSSPLRRQPRYYKKTASPYLAYGKMSSPLKPAGVRVREPWSCKIPGCMFTSTTSGHLDHHLRTFQHGVISPPSAFDTFNEDDVEDDAMEMF